MSHLSPAITVGAVALAFAGSLTVNTVGLPATTAPTDPAAAPAASAPPVTTPSAPTSSPRSAAPTPPPEPKAAEQERQFAARVTYAGRTEDGTPLAVAIDGDRAIAYVCDGRAVEAWLSGPVGARTLVLTNDDGDQLGAELDGARLDGEVRVGRDTAPFRLRSVTKPAGLYRAKSGDTTTGWIVLPDSQVGLQTSRVRTEPAPELDPDDDRRAARALTGSEDL